MWSKRSLYFLLCLLLAVSAFSSPLEELQALKTEVQNSINDLKSISQDLTISSSEVQALQTKLENLNNRLELLEQNTVAKLEALEKNIQEYQKALLEYQQELKRLTDEYKQLLNDWKKYQKELALLKTVSISSGVVAVVCLVLLTIVLLGK